MRGTATLTRLTRATLVAFLMTLCAAQASVAQGGVNAAPAARTAAEVRCSLGIYDFPEIRAKGVPCSQAKTLIRTAKRADWPRKTQRILGFSCTRRSGGQVIECTDGSKWVLYNVNE